MSRTPWNWVVVADAHVARIFRYIHKHQPWQQVEELRPTSPESEGTSGMGHRAEVHQAAVKGQAGSSPKEKEERHFAHLLAHRLERGMADEAFDALALVAPPKLLGELRETLSRGLQKRVSAELHKDYTHLPIQEVAEKLRPELPLTVS